MAGALTHYLQREFARTCPPGWLCRSEVQLLPKQLADLLGYSPRVDVLFEREGGHDRLWVEFEVSRADPVANHAKFATCHLFEPQRPGDVFVAMVSAHVSRGRRNLASNTVSLMRRVGMAAFQTTLFPHLSGERIKELNHIAPESLDPLVLPVEREVERAMLVVTPLLVSRSRRIHFAGEPLDVMLNVKNWNRELDTPEGRAVWGKRTIKYFVADTTSGEFAPSKFCAYVPVTKPIARPGGIASPWFPPVMTMSLYATLDGVDSRFDGNRARVHLEENLAFAPRRWDQHTDPALKESFARWRSNHRDTVVVHQDRPVILVPPPWFQ
jgi:hypothetical protein